MEELVCLAYPMKRTRKDDERTGVHSIAMKSTRQEEDELVFSILNEKD
jgi:hypothetical protein